MNSPLQIEYAAERKVNPVPRRLASTWRAEQELGFQAVVPFQLGMERLVAWWRNQRENEVAA